MILVASMFRQSASYVDRYFDQVNALRQFADVQLVVAEGDSTDETYAQLDKSLRPTDALLKIDHGGPRYGSIDHGPRWDDIALVMRGITAEVAGRLNGADAFVWVESDLVWTPAAVLALLDDLATVPAVAPMIFAEATVRFYDIWGFRKDGQKFAATSPYHPSIGAGLAPIDSCGSCFALAPSAFPSLLSWDGHWPFTADGDLWLDPKVVVTHPGGPR